MRSLVVVALLFTGIVATWSQTLSDIENQSEVSQLLNAHGALYILETHHLPSLNVLGSAPIGCKIVVLRVLSRAALSQDDKMTVGLELTVQDDRLERIGRLDAKEAQALLSYLELIRAEGRAILKEPTVSAENGWSAEIHYSTKEKVKMAAFVNHSGSLKFAVKVGPRADWLILTKSGVDALAANLQRTIDADQSLGI